MPREQPTANRRSRFVWPLLACALVTVGAVVAWRWFGSTPSDAEVETRVESDLLLADESGATESVVRVDSAIADAPVPPASRKRVTRVAPQWLDRKRSPFFDSRAAGTTVQLALWDDLILPVTLRGSEVIGQDRTLVRGEVDGVPGSRFLLTVAGDEVAFSVYLGGEVRFGGVPTGDGRVVVYELDVDAMPACGGGVVAWRDGDALAVLAARAMAATTGSGASGGPSAPPIAAAAPQTTAQVDVLMLYTPEVSPGAQPDSALLARVDLAFAEANDEFARSETRVAIRRVGLARTSYTETGSNSTSLDRLRRTSDGFMDEVHALRDQLGADLVCLLVQRSDPSSIGIAYILRDTADPERAANDLFAFSVVQNAYVAGSSTFSHELGHNLGCAHDRENSSSQGAFSFSYGYRFTGSDARTYRTIMAYQPGRSVPYFSNPNVISPEAQRPVGLATGSPGEADNAASINRLAYAVAAYRTNQVDPPARGRLTNVSTRAWVGQGDEVLIGGFFVGPPGPKQVLLRVRSNFLTQFGVTDVLANPQLRLVRQSDQQTLVTNSDWGSAPNAGAIFSTGLAPEDPAEPAILVTLDAGGYTAIASGENGTTGLALVEVFEIDPGEAPKLVNLSTRGFVGTGDRVMIGGLIVAGNAGETKRVLVRALGPSLADAGVSNALFDPALRLYNQNSEELLDNDDWDFLNDKLQAEVQALGLAPGVRRESVLLIDLPPGNYTVIVRPFENPDEVEPGVGLIEAYEITQP